MAVKLGEPDSLVHKQWCHKEEHRWQIRPGGPDWLVK